MTHLHRDFKVTIPVDNDIGDSPVARSKIVSVWRDVLGINEQSLPQVHISNLVVHAAIFDVDFILAFVHKVTGVLVFSTPLHPMCGKLAESESTLVFEKKAANDGGKTFTAEYKSPPSRVFTLRPPLRDSQIPVSDIAVGLIFYQSAESLEATPGRAWSGLLHISFDVVSGTKGVGEDSTKHTTHARVESEPTLLIAKPTKLRAKRSAKKKPAVVSGAGKFASSKRRGPKASGPLGKDKSVRRVAKSRASVGKLQTL